VSPCRGEQQCVLARMEGARFRRRCCCCCWRASASTNLMLSCTSPTSRYSVARLCPVLGPRRRREPAVCIARVWTSRAEAVALWVVCRACVQRRVRLASPGLRPYKPAARPAPGGRSHSVSTFPIVLHACLLRMCACATWRHSFLPSHTSVRMAGRRRPGRRVAGRPWPGRPWQGCPGMWHG
jgi:hypothetical protein